jgi:hypothetical protein
VKLALIGLVAGFMSALFGVGGGIVVVPLLILRARVHAARRDRDVARGDRDHRARRHDHVRDRRRGRPGVRVLVGLPLPPARPSARRSSSACRPASSRTSSLRLLVVIAIWLLV